MAHTRALLVATLVVSLVVPAVAVGHAATGATTSAVAAPETDNSVTRVAVRSDGDARWTVRIRTRLDSEEDVERYRSFQRKFRNDTARFLDPFAGRMGGVVAGAENATDREMNASSFAASTDIQEVPRRWGVVSFSFTWTNFARVDGGRLLVGDVFEGGFFLAEGDSLVVEVPSGYAVGTADPRPAESDGTSVTWVGREDFADGRPRVVLESAEAPPNATASPSPAPRAGGLPLGALALGGVVLLAGFGATLYVRRQGWSPRGANGGDDGTSGDDVSVMTDAERVEQVLTGNGGRMKQADVADELGWSASKTSRVVGGMVDDGRVEKLRVGRENVLDLPK